MSAQLQLYTRPFCGFCSRVKHFLKEYALEIEQHNIWTDPTAAKALLAGGGRTMVPCLRIEDPSGEVRWMYESADIISYLQETLQV